ncbi:hypothetical protein K1719_011312 [Acacia pycnantha]|nr:hypothetical protein K1719_011312 [Acacia pycnantha]
MGEDVHVSAQSYYDVFNIRAEQGKKEGGNIAEASASTANNRNEQDVWRVVQKAHRRKKESNEKGANDPQWTSGSRFGVLVAEGERESDVVKGKDSANMAVVVQNGVMKAGEKPRNDVIFGSLKEVNSDDDKVGYLSEQDMACEGQLDGEEQLARLGPLREEAFHDCGPLDPGDVGPTIGLVGRFGGILAAWKSSLIEVEVLNFDRQLIHLKYRFPNDRWFCITVVYAILDNTHKQILSNSIRCFASSMVYPWTVIGDFNDVAFLSERTGGLGGNEARCSLFSDRMNECGLLDLGAVGPKFTWKGPKLNGGRRLYERLGRAIANDRFLSVFPECYVQVLPRTGFSNHNPI